MRVAGGAAHDRHSNNPLLPGPDRTSGHGPEAPKTLINRLFHPSDRSEPMPRPVAPSPFLPAVKTHRELFSDFFTSLFGYDLQQLIADSPAPHHAKALFEQMMRDISSGGTALNAPLEQVGA